MSLFVRSRRSVVLLALAGLIGAAGPALAESAIAVDVASGKVLSQNNATERRYPASTTKLMTAYVALHALRTGRVALDTPVVMTRAASLEAPSKMGFQPGSVMRLDMALRMMLVKSANDVAHAIGQAIGGGDLDAFVAEMNETAARLGMMDTRFINANGLPGEGQYSSAKDLAILGLAIRRELPEFSGYFGTEAISTGKALMQNGNKLLGRFDGADGMKTGYTCAAGFNLVSSATRDNRTVVVVVLGAESTISRERESAAMLEAGFKTKPEEVSQTVDALPASGGMPIDISEDICSQKGRTARANERVEEAKGEEFYGSPFLHEMNRPPATVLVSLGGAAAGRDITAGVTLVESYGVPLPTPRPFDLELPYIDAPPSLTKPADTPMAGGPAPDAAGPMNSLAPTARPAPSPMPGDAEEATPEAEPQGAALAPARPRSQMAEKGPRLGYEAEAGAETAAR